MIKEIAFSCYAVRDIAKARRFYEGVLGLRASSVFEQDNMGFIEYEIGPHTLAIGAGAPTFSPGREGAVVAFEVDDFDVAVQKLRAAKVPFIMEPADTGPCRMTLVEDPDGNRLMIHKRKQG